MKISKIEAYKVSIKLKGTFRIALGEIFTSEGYIVRIETNDGLVGYGEASPSKAILGDDMDLAFKTLREVAEQIRGINPINYERWRRILRNSKGSSSAKAAIEIALFDIIGKHYSSPLYRLFGGAKDKIETDYTIGIKDPETAAKEAYELVREGYRILKVKLGETKETDIERVKAIREVVGSKIRIRVDANQGWDFETAKEVIKEIYKYDVELVEQPLKAHDLKGLAKLRKASPIPIMLDESVHTAEDAVYAIKIGAADVINIKLMKAQGITEAIRIAHIAESEGIPCMVGCMVETEIGILAGIHLACGLANIKYADLDADLYNTEHIVAVKSLEVPYRIPPSRPGLGFEEENLNRRLMRKVLEVK